MIIVTGASGGIGRTLVEHLSQTDSVIGIYNRTKPEEDEHSAVRYQKLDLQNEAEIQEFVASFQESLSQITLVHGAVLSIDELAIKFEAADWDRVMDVNLKGAFLLTKALLGRMLEEKFGRIIHLSSIVGMRGERGTVAYSASKTALIGMSKVLAKEYARFNITSNILALGYFQEGLIHTLSDSAREEIRREIPAKKFGDVENIVHAVRFLIKSEYTNGAVINIDGGF